MRTAVRARWAVGVLFLTNGAVVANLVPRYPDVVDALDLSATAFGAAVGAYGLGALALGPVAGPLVHRFGSARVALAAVLLACATLVVAGLAASWAVLAGALLVAGTADAVADVAENSHGLRVERLLGRSVLNTMHALWSVGAVLGGLMGSAAAAHGVPVAWHLSAAALLLAVVGVAAYRALLPGADREPLPTGDPAAPGRHRHRLRTVGLVVALGAVAASAQLMEDTTATWSALYLREGLGAGAGVAGLGFVALQAAQTVGRLLGDPAVTRWGDVAVARAGGALALAATAATLLPAVVLPVLGLPGWRPGPGAEVVATVVALALVGLGIGTVIPSAMRRADELPGLRAGTGLTLVSTVLRTSIVASPVLLGLLADAAGLQAVMASLPLAALVLVLLAGVLARPGSRSSARAPAHA